MDHIVGFEWRNGGLYYQVRWKGYDPIEDTMERAAKFAEMTDVLNDLCRRLPEAPMPGEVDDSKPKPKTNKRKAKRV